MEERGFGMPRHSQQHQHCCTRLGQPLRSTVFNAGRASCRFPTEPPHISARLMFGQSHNGGGRTVLRWLTWPSRMSVVAFMKAAQSPVTHGSALRDRLRTILSGYSMTSFQGGGEVLLAVQICAYPRKACNENVLLSRSVPFDTPTRWMPAPAASVLVGLSLAPADVKGSEQ